MEKVIIVTCAIVALVVIVKLTKTVIRYLVREAGVSRRTAKHAGTAAAIIVLLILSQIYFKWVSHL